MGRLMEWAKQDAEVTASARFVAQKKCKKEGEPHNKQHSRVYSSSGDSFRAEFEYNKS
jgi:hypothetical protein